MREHVDSETLAAFREELLPRRKARRVAAHLAHCAQCAGLDAQLADLPVLLARTSAPPMPDALTARIEAALAAEAAARATLAPAGAAAAETAGTTAEAPGGAGGGAGPTQPHDAGSRRRAGKARPAPVPGRSRLALRIAAAAAAIVVIGGGGYGVTRLLSGGGAGQGSAASGASAPEAGRAAAPNTKLGRAEHGAAGAGSKARSPFESPSAPITMLSSGVNYRTDQLKAQVEATIAQVRRKVPSPGPSHSVSGTAVLPSCLRRVAGNQRPLLVDTARYNGSPATIIVLTTANAKTLQVVVAGPRCSATQTDLITSTVIPAPR